MASDKERRAKGPRARLCGLLYLIVIAAGVFTEALVINALAVRGDAAATVRNIAASQSLYRAGFVANLVDYSVYVAVTLLLFELLAPVNRRLSAAAAAFSLVGSAIVVAASVFYMTPLLLLSDQASTAGLGEAQINAVVALAFKLRAFGYVVSLVFFGVHMILIGVLVVRSGFLPRILGMLQALGGLGYLASSLVTILWPDVARHFSAYALLLSVGAELALALWLLLIGVDPGKWRAGALGA